VYGQKCQPRLQPTSLRSRVCVELREIGDIVEIVVLPPRLAAEAECWAENEASLRKKMGDTELCPVCG